MQQPVLEVGNICVFLKKTDESIIYYGKLAKFFNLHITWKRQKKLDSTEQKLSTLKKT